LVILENFVFYVSAWDFNISSLFFIFLQQTIFAAKVHHKKGRIGVQDCFQKPLFLKFFVIEG